MTILDQAPSIAVFLAFALGIVLGRWSRKPRTVRISSSSYFHQRPDVYPVMASWRADAVDAARRTH